MKKDTQRLAGLFLVSVFSNSLFRVQTKHAEYPNDHFWGLRWPFIFNPTVDSRLSKSIETLECRMRPLPNGGTRADLTEKWKACDLNLLSLPHYDPWRYSWNSSRLTHRPIAAKSRKKLNCSRTFDQSLDIFYFKIGIIFGSGILIGNFIFRLLQFISK